MLNSKDLPRIPAASIRSILESLEQWRRQDPSAHSALKVDTDGHSYHGELLDYDRQHRVLLLRLLDNQTGHRLTYLPESSIRALTVDLAENDLHVVSFGKVRKPLGKAPGRLDLQRQLKSASDKIADQIDKAFTLTCRWAEFPKEDDVHAGLSLFFGDLESSLNEVLADEVGRLALAEKLSGIEIAAGPKQSAGVAKGLFLVTLVVGTSGLEIPSKEWFDQCLCNSL